MYEEAKKNGKEGMYYWWKADKYMTKAEMVAYWEDICARYPVISVEDGVSEEDWEAWKMLTDALGQKVQLVGDDLFVTKPNALKKGIDHGRRRQLHFSSWSTKSGSSRNPRSIEMANRAGYTAVTSYRSVDRGRHIADIAVGDQLRPIRPARRSRSDRGEDNQLLRIEWNSDESPCIPDSMPGSNRRTRDVSGGMRPRGMIAGACRPNLFGGTIRTVHMAVVQRGCFSEAPLLLLRDTMRCDTVNAPACRRRRGARASRSAPAGALQWGYG